MNRPTVQNEQTDCSNWTDGSVQNEHMDLFKMNRPIPETNKDINKDINKEINKDIYKREEETKENKINSAAFEFLKNYVAKKNKTQEKKNNLPKEKNNDEQKKNCYEILNSLPALRRDFLQKQSLEKLKEYEQYFSVLVKNKSKYDEKTTRKILDCYYDIKHAIRDLEKEEKTLDEEINELVNQLTL